MHQFLKNLVFVVAVNATFVGVPFGVSKLVGHAFVFGGISASASVLILAISMWIAGYYHNRSIDVTGVGYFVGLLSLVGGSFAMITYGFVDTVVFSKLFIIAVALFFHTLTDVKSVFWVQKVALSVAFISVAFLSTLPLLGLGATITFVLYIVSIVLHTKNKIQENN